MPPPRHAPGASPGQPAQPPVKRPLTGQGFPAELSDAELAELECLPPMELFVVESPLYLAYNLGKPRPEEIEKTRAAVDAALQARRERAERLTGSPPPPPAASEPPAPAPPAPEPPPEWLDFAQREVDRQLASERLQELFSFRGELSHRLLNLAE